MEHLSYVCTGSLKESVRFMNCLKPAGGAEGQEHLQRSRHEAEEEGKLPCQWSWARVEVRKMAAPERLIAAVAEACPPRSPLASTTSATFQQQRGRAPTGRTRASMGTLCSSRARIEVLLRQKAFFAKVLADGAPGPIGQISFSKFDSVESAWEEAKRRAGFIGVDDEERRDS